MTPEMAFQCFLVSRDPAVISTLDPILRELSVCTDVCPDASKVVDVLGQVSTDLLVIDLDGRRSAELIRQVYESHKYQKPTILAVSAKDRAVPGVHVVLRKPVTPESGLKSLKAAYSRMLQDFRQHTRFALMSSVLVKDEQDRTLSVIVTNVGEGGVGLTAKQKLTIGSVLSFRLPLPGLRSELTIQARVLWTRDYGAAGCEFVHVAPFDRQLLNAWLQSRYRIKKPMIPI
jgi:PilZ domain